MLCSQLFFNLFGFFITYLFYFVFILHFIFFPLPNKWYISAHLYPHLYRNRCINKSKRLFIENTCPYLHVCSALSHNYLHMHILSSIVCLGNKPTAVEIAISIFFSCLSKNYVTTIAYYDNVICVLSFYLKFLFIDLCQSRLSLLTNIISVIIPIEYYPPTVDFFLLFNKSTEMM